MKEAILAWAVKVGIRLAIKAHRGPIHNLTEKWRLEIEAAEKKEGSK